MLAVDTTLNMFWLFVGWAVAQTLWIWYAAKIRAWPFLVSQLVYGLIDVVGLIKFAGKA